jgi:hypothetical protein
MSGPAAATGKARVPPRLAVRAGLAVAAASLPAAAGGEAARRTLTVSATVVESCRARIDRPAAAPPALEIACAAPHAAARVAPPPPLPPRHRRDARFLTVEF